MDCQGKKGAKKQKEVLQEITDTIKAKQSITPTDYEKAAQALKEYIGRPLTTAEDVTLIVTGKQIGRAHV